MESHDLQAIKKPPERAEYNCGKSSMNENKEIGSTEIISKYNNYHITKIVTDISSNEATEISKITIEALEDIIGGCVCEKRQKISEKENVLINIESDETNPADSSDINTPSIHTPRGPLDTPYVGKCYVRLEYNQIIENLQKTFMNHSKTQRKEKTILSQPKENSRMPDLDSPVKISECATIEQKFESTTKEDYTNGCYVRMKMDPKVESMQNEFEQISGTEFKHTPSDISTFCDKKCIQYNTKTISFSNSESKNRKRKTFEEYNINQNMGSVNNTNERYRDVNLNIERKSVLPHPICKSTLSQEAIRKVLTEMSHYERENNILIYENLRIENSVNNAMNKIKFLEKELHDLKETNNSSFLKKYFTDNEITALSENTIFDWNNKMITKAMQLRFACGNEGYEELSKDFNLPSLKILRKKVHNSQFDMALLAKDMIQF